MAHMGRMREEGTGDEMEEVEAIIRQLEDALRREARMRLQLDDVQRENAILRSEIQQLQFVIALRPRLSDEELRHVHDRAYQELLARLSE